MNRIIPANLSGKLNLEILNSVIGQMSDGKWENSPHMVKYWDYVDVVENDTGIHFIVRDDFGSGFRDKTPEGIRAFFANKIKQIVKDEHGDDIWDRRQQRVCHYLSYKESVTVADAYRAYDILKGRTPRVPRAPKGPSELDNKVAKLIAKAIEIDQAKQKLKQLEREMAVLSRS